MANIGFDAKRAFRNFSGLGNYSRSLIHGISRLYPYHRYFLYTPQYKGAGQWLHFSKGENISIVKPQGIYKLLPSPVWRSSGIRSDLKKDGIELFHGLSGELPATPSHIRKVVTMHDVIFLRYPEFYKSTDRYLYEKKFRQACRTADKIIAISRQTADDLISFLGADPSRIEIIYQGCDNLFHIPPTPEQLLQVKEKYRLPDKFILNVGTIETRKNLANVVKALAEVPEEVQLIALGRATPYVEEVKATIAALGLGHRVRLIHNATFADFPSLYKQAVAITYVSVFEGFGIPVLEGITVGTPVITSNISSMPEAGGDAALYVNPENPHEIAANVNMLLSSPTIVGQILEKGKIHAAKFREENVIEHVYDIYHSLLK